MRPGSAGAMLDHGETRVPNHCITADMDDTGAVSHEASKSHHAFTKGKV